MSSRKRKFEYKYEHEKAAKPSSDLNKKISFHLQKNHFAYAIIAIMILLFFMAPLGWWTLAFIIFAIYIWHIEEYESRIPIGFALLLLVMAAAFLARGSEIFANNLATYAYYFLVIGVVLEAVEYVHEGRINKKVQKKSFYREIRKLVEKLE